MNVLLFGATGMVGQGVLRECLRDPEVRAVVAVGRSSTGQPGEKLREIVVDDVADLSRVEAQLAGFDACFFCLGVSAMGMPEKRYTELTHDLTLAVAQTVGRLNPGMTFVYVSGAGTDATERGRAMWARVKGRTENALRRLPFKGAYMFRPAVIVPMHGVRSRTTWYRLFYASITPLYPALRALFPNGVTTTERSAARCSPSRDADTPRPCWRPETSTAYDARRADAAEARRTMIVHLVDGTYELFRHFYGSRRAHKGEDRPFGAVTGVLHTVLEMIEKGATHVGVATDHVIESFRNGLWSDYKTGEGVERALLAQFHPLEDALAAMGVAVWPMIELEADDALASAARIASADARVQKVCIWTPDKDLAQCVRGDRVVQIDRRGQRIRDAEGVREKFGVEPGLIPDFLALTGDAADGYPGIPGIGPITAARLLNRHGAIETFPPDVLGNRRDLALLFKDLATLRTDARLFDDVDALRWRGPTPLFAECAQRLGHARLLERAVQAPVA